ncbi:hypothetical protein BJV74DRAFT_398713 [Russula compacta]|nr:hypothetical protein BJV74DRAFT_398713 [Russula compacta]
MHLSHFLLSFLLTLPSLSIMSLSSFFVKTVSTFVSLPASAPSLSTPRSLEALLSRQPEPLTCALVQYNLLLVYSIDLCSYLTCVLHVFFHFILPFISLRFDTIRGSDQCC